jgi:hypothetical protein
MAEILLAVETNLSRAPQLSSARLLNFFTERQPPEAKGQAPLFGAPGISGGVEVGTGASRGSWNFNGVGYFVQGNDLCVLNSGGTSETVGSGIGGSGPVSMSDNGVQLCIVNGSQGWIYTLATGILEVITSPAFYPAFTVTFMDGYFIFDRAGTNEWFLSALYDGTTYNGLDFASAEGQPGFVTATVQNLQLLFIVCTGHIELWYDAGTADFPFQRYAGGIINYGCISPYTILKQDGAIFLLGADKVVYRLQANVPIRVSSHAIEHAIQNCPQIANAFAMTWTLEGHKMVCLTVPSGGLTECFDISTGRWHDRNSVDANFNDLGAWRVTTALQIYNQTYLGDGLSANVGILDWTTYTEFGFPMMGVIQSANQQRDRKRVFCGRFELDVQAGVGLTSGQGSNPLIILQKSKDGGMTYGINQYPRSMGKQGEYRKRLRWIRQGESRQLMWRLVITDPVQRVIIAAFADISFGM